MQLRGRNFVYFISTTISFPGNANNGTLHVHVYINGCFQLCMSTAIDWGSCTSDSILGLLTKWLELMDWGKHICTCRIQNYPSTLVAGGALYYKPAQSLVKLIICTNKCTLPFTKHNSLHHAMHRLPRFDWPDSGVWHKKVIYTCSKSPDPFPPK